MDKNTNNVANIEPSIFPDVPSIMYLLMTNMNTCPIAKHKNDAYKNTEQYKAEENLCVKNERRLT